MPEPYLRFWHLCQAFWGRVATRGKEYDELSPVFYILSVYWHISGMCLIEFCIVRISNVPKAFSMFTGPTKNNKC